MSNVPPGLPGQLGDDDGPIFCELWEARAFIIALALHQRGLFSWPEWAPSACGRNSGGTNLR